MGNIITPGGIELIIKDILKLEESIPHDSNLLEYGLSSIQVMQLTGRWRKAGYDCTAAKLFTKPTISGWSEVLTGEAVVDLNSEKGQDVDMYQPFLLTDVQYAYWIGRSEGQYLGNVGCHGYLEIDGKDVDPVRLSDAWDALQEYHPMLRVRFTPDGKQQVMKQAYKKGIEVYDFRERDPEKHLAKMREHLSHRLMDIEHGQVAEIQLTLLHNNATRIHFDIDLLIADVKSYQIILRDLLALYMGTAKLPAPKEWNFASYLVNDKKQNITNVNRAKKYWSDRLETLPGKPELPLRADINNAFPEFKRHSAVLSKEKWEKFQTIAAGYKVTPAMALLALYGNVVARWSENNHFLMNIPLFNRDAVVNSIEHVVADFTTISLLEMNITQKDSFIHFVRDVQRQFHKDMEHTAYSGIQVQRDYLKIHPEQNTVAPVVFSCNLGFPLVDEEFQRVFGKMGYMISQTPQVWLDFQVFDMPEGLLMIWDGIESLFPDNILLEMFAAYTSLLNRLAADNDAWDDLLTINIEKQIMTRHQHEESKELPEEDRIHAGLYKNTRVHPEKVAIIDTSQNRKISYKMLCDRSLQIAGYLLSQGVKTGDCVGIDVSRGSNQIEAMFGVMAVGGKYVAIGKTQPLSRKKVICKKADINYVISDDCSGLADLSGIQVIDINGIPTDLMLTEPVITGGETSAYVIFTSGSTGEPKGVEVSHRAAFNTITDINHKLAVNPSDVVLGVSAIDFDLSVYDVFGIIAAGGSLVLIPEEQRRSADVWVRLVKEHSITVWNSVPALFDMLLMEADAKNIELKELRLSLLSGDWIGMDLPERTAHVAPNCRFISLGGATEGAIWSNYFEVELPIPTEWRSIPYGYPLCNQKYRVVDSQGNDCPDWVAGELWIGGVGVAVGYIGDSEITKKQFVEWKGEKWYRTGDMGRYWSDGVIEFLGRRDNQVKIRGHRIELEEIENRYRQHPGVAGAVVVPAVNNNNRKYLASFIVPRMMQEDWSIQHRNTMNKAIEFAVEQITSSDKENTPTAEEYSRFSSEIDAYVISKICKILQEITWEVRPNIEYDVAQKIASLRIDKQYHELLYQWLELLEEHNVVKKGLESATTYSNMVDLNTAGAAVGGILQDRYSDILQAADIFVRHGKSMLLGELEPVEIVFEEGKNHISSMADQMPWAEQKNEMIVTAIVNVLGQIDKGEGSIRILEIGSRKLNLTKMLLDKLSEFDITYVCSDNSIYFAHQVENMIGDKAEYIIFDPEVDTVHPDTRKFDLIISFDSLHRVKDIHKALKNLSAKINSGGMLLASEVVGTNSIQLLTAGFLEKGFSELQDFRKELKSPLLKASEWINVLSNSGFENATYYPNIDTEEIIYDQVMLVAYKSSNSANLSSEVLNTYLQGYLPEYMIPTTTIILDEFPSTQNGKIDRKHLESLLKNNEEDFKKSLPVEKTAIDIAVIWKNILHVDQIYLEDDFYLLGGDSLVATELNLELEKQLGINTGLETIFKYPIFNDFIKEVERRNAEVSNSSSSLEIMVVDAEHIHEPFPLTDIQQSYWIGRSGVYNLGEVGTHCYFEMDCSILDVEKIEWAWNKLICRHEMMRAIIMEDGRSQRILKETTVYKIVSNNVRNEAELESIRQKMATKVFSPSVWPLFDIRVSTVDDQFSRLHLSFDNIVFDGFSIFRLFSEWKTIYEGKETFLPPITGSFRDYVLALEAMKQTERYQDDLAYWKERVPEMSLAPQLPVLRDSKDQRFTRFETRLNKKEWNLIKNLTETYHLTSTVVLLGAYAEVIGRYSKSQQFTLNLTRFNKLPLGTEIDNLIGDFTSLTLLAVDNTKGGSFIDRCRNIQEQLLADLNHSLVSGVVVERELMKHSGGNEITMPVVFTSGFGINTGKNNTNEYLGDISYGESQTPQTWLDHQVFEQDEELFVSWDAVCGLFPEGFINEMFDVYKELLASLCKAGNWIGERASLIHIPRIDDFENENCILSEPSEDTLLSLFEKSLETCADNIAIKSSTEKLSYKELDDTSNRIAARLLSKGVKKGNYVGILMDKGINQVATVLGIMKAGAAYVPLDPHNPAERIKYMLNQANVAVVCTENKVLNGFGEEIKSFDLFDVTEQSDYPYVVPAAHIERSDIAYVIYTSGSTGDPKGVMIEHQGAVNTILDINQKYSINHKDATFLLSNLNFDLSVYDIFGMLSAGGCIIIPDADKVKEPSHWIEMMNQKDITVWNTVPAFMQMLTEHRDIQDKLIIKSLRLVLLSGDWIPIDLPSKIRDIFGNLTIVGLGGATEASIWSNYFDIPEEIPADWISIPYGKPLTNQKYYILNELYEKCPVWVPGGLYIAGSGVAKGYVGDPEKTAESFLQYGSTGETLYKTGDNGRYWPDGMIEFLGREDNQIKLGGHRIEIGEIESQLDKIPGIKECIVSVVRGSSSYLVAHLVIDALMENGIINYEETDAVFDIDNFKMNYTDNVNDLLESYPVKEIERYTRAVEVAATNSILADLVELGFLSHEEAPLLQHDLLSSPHIDEPYKRLVANAISAVQERPRDFSDNYLDDELKRLEKRLADDRATRMEILSGKREAKALLINNEVNFLVPSEVAQYDRTRDITNRLFLEALSTWYSSMKKDSIRVLEIGSRAEDNTRAYVDLFSNCVEFIYLDESMFYLDKKKELLGEDNISYVQCKLEQAQVMFEIEQHSIDLIIADNTLHRYQDLNVALSNIKRLLAPGGWLAFKESTENTALILQTVAYFEKGYNDLADFRKEVGLPLLGARQWIQLLKKQKFESCYELLGETLNKCIIFSQMETRLSVLDYDALRNEIRKRVPEYMMPSVYFTYEELPITANGKIDRKRLAEFASEAKRTERKENAIPTSTEEIAIAEKWCQLLETEDKNIKSNFFEMGGDSLKAIMLINALNEAYGYDISLQELFDNPTIEQLGRIVLNNAADKMEKDGDLIQGSI